MKWIRTDERLPAVYEWVHITDKRGHVWLAYMIESDARPGARAFVFDHKHTDVMDVLAWMPIPKPEPYRPGRDNG